MRSMVLRVALLTVLSLPACGGTSVDVPDAAGLSIDASTPDASANAFMSEVTVTDTSNILASAHDALIACANGGLAEWGKYVGGAGVLSVEIRVQSTATGRLAGASTSNESVGPCRNTSACTLVEEQAIHRLRTGQDNPAMVGVPDVHVDVDTTYWNTQVWVDPDPVGRTAMVPSDRLDCVSLFTHELSHAFGMTGFRDLTTFLPTVAFQSLYDDLVHVGASTLTFEGPLAAAVFGPIPLTRTNTTQNVYHYADKSTPSSFDTLLMNGIMYEYGHRYRVQKVDVLILQDLGMPIYAVPAT